MSPYTPQDIFTDPEIYDLSDLVQGGLNGDANTPIKSLFDQANYIKKRLSRWDDIMTITGDHAWDSSDLRKFLIFQISANKTFTLPDPGSLLPGARLPIAASITGVKSLTILSPKPILQGTRSWTSWQDDSQAAIYMHDAETLILVAGTQQWYVESPIGNFNNYGEDYPGRVQDRNSLVANGTPYARADVPRLALYMKRLGPGVVDDATWLSNPGGEPVYRGCYSSGNGSTTLRVPDERAMSVRHLDLGRGIDLSRLYNQSGGYEKDAVLRHDHPFQVPPEDTSQGQDGTGLFVGGGGNHEPVAMPLIRTGMSSGPETIVKNIGKIPLIRY